MNDKFDIGIYADYLIPMTSSEVKENVFIGVKGNKIATVCSYKPSLKRKCKKFILGKEMLCMPGFVNGHVHLPMTLFRGLEDDVPFHVWLFERILPLEQKIVDKNFIKAGTELAALESIRFGVTTLNEMYFYLEETAKVLNQCGLRAIVSQTFADFPLPEDKDIGTDKFAVIERASRKYKKHSRIRIGLAPHAPYSCSDDLLLRIRDVAKTKELPIHIHVSETQKEVYDSLEKYKKTPVRRLYDLGILSKKTICAHCVHLNELDMEIFAKTQSVVVHNPDSNLKLASGIAPIAQYREKNIPTMFGTDGTASNNDLSMFGAMDIGTKVQKLSQKKENSFGAYDAVRMATVEGAKNLGYSNLGTIAEGQLADLILVDLSYPHLQPVNNIFSHLVYSAQGLEVDTTICDGKILMQNKKVLSLNQNQVFANAKKWQKKIEKQLRDIKSE